MEKNDEWRAIPLASSLNIEMPDTIVAAVNRVIDNTCENIRNEYVTRLTSSESDAMDLEKLLIVSEERIEEQLEQISILEHQLANERYRCEKLLDEISFEKDKSEKYLHSTELARIEVAKLSLQLEGVNDLKSEVAKLRDELKISISVTAEAEKNAAITNVRLEDIELPLQDN